jgi:hypothetical protein
MYRIPAFKRFPSEMAIIGRLLIAFSELEFKTMCCAGEIMNGHSVLKVLYLVGSSHNRIDAADALMRHHWDNELSEPYVTMITALKLCEQIREQFAHCIWDDRNGSGLCFANPAESEIQKGGFNYHWYRVGVVLLAEQEAYFNNTYDWLVYLENERHLRVGKAQNNAYEKPTTLNRPPLYHDL